MISGNLRVAIRSPPLRRSLQKNRRRRPGQGSKRWFVSGLGQTSDPVKRELFGLHSSLRDAGRTTTSLWAICIRPTCCDSARAFGRSVKIPTFWQRQPEAGHPPPANDQSKRQRRDHSYRRAAIGSTPAALLAWREQAIAATRNNRAFTASRTNGIAGCLWFPKKSHHRGIVEEYTTSKSRTCCAARQPETARIWPTCVIFIFVSPAK